MNEDQPQAARLNEIEPQPSKAKAGRFWQCFWLSFLVVSLGYAWYSFYAPSNRIAWSASYAAAQEEAAELDKPVLLFFTGKWCSPCQIMKRQVWADEQVMAAVNGLFVPVAIDVDDPDAASSLSRYSIASTPTTIITDSRGNVLHYEQGRMSKAGFLELLDELDPSTFEGLKR